MFFTILQSEILNDWLRPSLGMKRLNPIENFAKNILRFLIGCFDLIPRGVNDLKCLSFLKNKSWRCGGCDFKLPFFLGLFCCNRTAIPRLPFIVSSQFIQGGPWQEYFEPKSFYVLQFRSLFYFAMAWIPHFFVKKKDVSLFVILWYITWIETLPASNGAFNSQNYLYHTQPDSLSVEYQALQPVTHF